MRQTDAADHNGRTVKKWFTRHHLFRFVKKHKAVNFRETSVTGKRLALLCWVIFLLSVPFLASAKSIWDFQEAVTPIAHDSMTMSVHSHRAIMVIYAAVFAIFLYSIFRHRKSSGIRPAAFTGPTAKWQWALAAFPFLLLIYVDFVLMGIPAVDAIIRMEDTSTAADMVVKVTASQWKWQYEYPEEGIKFVSAMATTQGQIHDKETKSEHYLLEVDNPLVLPTNKKVRILLTSTDVIHAWWVPSFGIKRDAVPGYLREMWVSIEKPGTYRGQCGQLCGEGHSFMPIVVEALAEPQFKEWVAKRKAVDSAASAAADKVWAKEELMAKGEEIYGRICTTCHQAGGRGLPGAFPPLAGSRIVNAPSFDRDGRLIKDGHLDRVINGKPGTAMQAFKNTLSDAEIAAVVTFEGNSFGNRTGGTVQPSQVKALR